MEQRLPESVVGQRGKFESYALLSRKPMEIFRESVTGNIYVTFDVFV